ncbi:S26 family signal peptidase [Sessilibacter corallicola]
MFRYGDNHDNSLDSITWGMVPTENMLAKLVLTW